MHSRNWPEPQPIVYDSPSVNNNENVKMEDPAYQAVNQCKL